MDWINYMVFFLVFHTMNTYLHQAATTHCSPLCQRMGYWDDWQAMATIRDGKFYLSLCVCIQLLKIIKFVSALVPKMGLAPNVLRKAFADLVFFGITFFLSLFAFSTMFYIQLGPFINDYATQTGAVIATCRALFGDFDMEEVMDNSASYANTLLFLTYLFVAVFIMLSMFFAILGESQANFRDDQREAKAAGTFEPEYGFLTASQEWVTDNVLLRLPRVGDKIMLSRVEARAQEIEAKKNMAPAPVDRIEARQLELNDKIDSLVQAVGALADSHKAHQQALEALQSRPQRPPSKTPHSSKSFTHHATHDSSRPGSRTMGRSHTGKARDYASGRSSPAREGGGMRMRGAKIEDERDRRWPSRGGSRENSEEGRRHDPAADRIKDGSRSVLDA